jgi:pimeloyl-ACP methyl ester carboxylesterase
MQPSGALYQICTPVLTPWNGELVVYAHGYTAPGTPATLPSEVDLLAPAFTLPGRAFAATSFRESGFAVTEAIADLAELLDVVGADIGTPSRVYLVGVSQGALIATLAMERRPELYDGALAMCGPLGGASVQVDYMGDFRVVFDFLFPGLIPPSPVQVPPELIEGWEAHYSEIVQPRVFDPAHAAEVADLLAATGAAFDAEDETTLEQTVSGLLWYNVHATNDLATRVDGQPFDNLAREYTGTRDDAALNEGVARYAAEPLARVVLSERYDATGFLSRPLVTLHTTGDEIVPYRHAALFDEKVRSTGSGDLHDHQAIPRYGHCNFEALEVVAAFGRLVALVEARN